MHTGRTSLPGGTLFRGAGGWRPSTHTQSDRGSPKAWSHPASGQGHCENSRSPRPCSPKSASRGKRVQEVSQELGKAEGPSPQPWEAAQEGEVGALWGRAAVEASQGEMEEAAPGQAPPPTAKPRSLLHLTQLHTDDQLGLGRHVLEHVRLEPPQHVGPQQIMQLLDLVFFGDVGKLFQEALQVATKKELG